MTADISSALPIACALLLVRFVAAEAMYKRALPGKDGPRFPVTGGLRLTLRLGGPFLLFVAYKMAQEANRAFNYGAALAVALLGCGCILGEPGQIVLSKNGIVQTAVFGLVRKQIEWTAAAASAPPRSQEVLVVGKDGRTITHSKYHVGRVDFISHLRRHGVSVQGA